MLGEFFPTAVYHSMIIKEEIGKLIEFAWKKGSYVSCLDNRFGPSVVENLKFMFAASTWEELFVCLSYRFCIQGLSYYSLYFSALSRI